MRIYDDYLNKIKNVMETGKRSGISGHSLADLAKSERLTTFLNEAKKPQPLLSLQKLPDLLGVTPRYDLNLGSHPDFQNVRTTGVVEKHYITSAFIDIKKSTNLFKKYEPETVLMITNTIQNAAIHTCLIFGGYIQRLHGDGLFVYFGRKGVDKKEAIEKSLQASSVFTYFVKHDLRNLFNEQGVEALYTRIGIDFGETDDVLWSLMGLGNISEITTCSLHTSLASKMQQSAESNGIVVGDNIKKYSEDRYFSNVSRRTKDESDRYIFQIPEENYNYSQYDFNWNTFLREQDFIVTDYNTGSIHLKQKNQNKVVENLKPIAEKSTPYLR